MDFRKKFQNDEQDNLCVYPCIICDSYDGGEYAMESVEDNRQESGIRVISRACKRCWRGYQKATSQIDNFYKYGLPHPWPIENDVLRRFLLKNDKIRKDLQELGLIS